MKPCLCSSNRLMEINGHSRDCFNCEIPHLNIEHDGYAPELPNICNGDDISFTFCLDCGKIQNYEPLSDGELIELLISEEDQETAYHNQQTDDEYDLFLEQRYPKLC